MEDPRTILKNADALLKRGDIPGAITLYASVAHFYAAQGFALKAVAVWKQIRAIAAQHHNASIDANARAQLITIYRSLALHADADAIEAERTR